MDPTFYDSSRGLLPKGSSVSIECALKSDLQRDWLQQESLISHCAINQLTYLLSHKRKELRLHIYYSTEQRVKLGQDLIDMRKVIFSNFDEHKSLEKRIQKYLLMSDDAGMQAILFLLLRLSDDELKGVKTAIEAAAKAISYY